MSEFAPELFGMIGVDIPEQRKCSKWSLLPVKDILRRKVLRQEPISLESVAEKTWEIAPSGTSVSRRAYYLPGQLERVTGWAFMSEHPRRQMEGGIEIVHAPTRGYLLKNAWLIDGVLYKNNACSYRHPRSRRWTPQLLVENEIDRGAVYCTEVGSKYFGQWLMDDCVTYPLASAEGVPITTAQYASPHTLAYEDWLGMRPARLQSAFLKEAVIFEDRGHNQHRSARFRAMSEKLLSRVKVQSHPGVFILRGGTGESRNLHNEMEMAEYLREKRGFRIVDITKTDFSTIVATCAGARVVAGIEGSHLIHGVMALPSGGAILTIQPPNRFCDSFKATMDRDQQHFGFVVGIAEGGGFRVDPDEVERTLDLFPAFPG
jgi:hypothetical protein